MKKEFKRENKNRRNCLSMKLKSIDRKRNIVAQDSFVICCCKRKQRKASVGLLCCCYWSRLVNYDDDGYIEWNRITCLSLLLLLLVIVLCILMMGHYEKFERNSDTGSLVLLLTILNWVPQFIMMSPLKGYELAVRIIISDVWYHFRFWNWNEMTSQDCNLFSLSIHFLEWVLGSVLVCDCKG